MKLKKPKKLFSFLAIVLCAFLLAGSIGTFKAHTAEASPTYGKYYQSLTQEQLTDLTVGDGTNHYIEYGEYPQSEITDSSTVNSIKSALKYFNDDGSLKNMKLSQLQTQRKDHIDKDKLNYDPETGYFTANVDMGNGIKAGDKFYEYISGMNALEKYPYYVKNSAGTNLDDSIRSLNTTKSSTGSTNVSNYYYYSADGSWQVCSCTECGNKCLAGSKSEKKETFTYKNSKDPVAGDWVAGRKTKWDSAAKEWAQAQAKGSTKDADFYVYNITIKDRSWTDVGIGGDVGIKVVVEIEWTYSHSTYCRKCYNNHNHKAGVPAEYQKSIKLQNTDASKDYYQTVYYTVAKDQSNGYVAGTSYFFKVEPIKWRIVANNAGTYTLQSDIILDSMYFNLYQNNGNTYTTSYLNNWLNDDATNGSEKVTSENLQYNLVDSSKLASGVANQKNKEIALDNGKIYGRYTYESANTKNDSLHTTTFNYNKYVFQNRYKTLSTIGVAKATQTGYTNGNASFFNMAFKGARKNVLIKQGNYYVTVPETYQYVAQDSKAKLDLNDSKVYSDFAKATGLVCGYDSKFVSTGGAGDTNGTFWTSKDISSTNYGTNNYMPYRKPGVFYTASAKTTTKLLSDVNLAHVNQSAGIIPVIKININEFLNDSEFQFIDASVATGTLTNNEKVTETWIQNSSLLKIVRKNESFAAGVEIVGYEVDRTNNTLVVKFNRNIDATFLDDKIIRFDFGKVSQFATSGKENILFPAVGTEGTATETILIGLNSDQTLPNYIQGKKITLNLSGISSFSADSGDMIYAYVLSDNQQCIQMIKGCEIKTATWEKKTLPQVDQNNEVKITSGIVYEGEVVSFNIPNNGTTYYLTESGSYNDYLNNNSKIWDRTADIGDDSTTTRTIKYLRDYNGEGVSGWVNEDGDLLNGLFSDLSKANKLQLYDDNTKVKEYTVAMSDNLGVASSLFEVSKVAYIKVNNEERTITSSASEDQVIKKMYGDTFSFDFVIKGLYFKLLDNLKLENKTIASQSFQELIYDEDLDNTGDEVKLLSIYALESSENKWVEIPIKITGPHSTPYEYGYTGATISKEQYYTISTNEIGISTLVYDGSTKQIKLGQVGQISLQIRFNTEVFSVSFEGTHTIAFDGNVANTSNGKLTTDYLEFKNATVVDGINTLVYPNNGGAVGNNEANITGNATSISGIPYNSSFDSNIKIKTGYELLTNRNGHPILPNISFGYGAPVLDANGYRIAQNSYYPAGHYYAGQNKKLDTIGNVLEFNSDGTLIYNLGSSAGAQKSNYYKGIYFTKVDNNGDDLTSQLTTYALPILSLHIAQQANGSAEIGSFNGKVLVFVPTFNGNDIVYQPADDAQLIALNNKRYIGDNYITLDQYIDEENVLVTHHEAGLSYREGLMGEDDYWDFNCYGTHLKMYITRDTKEQIKYVVGPNGSDRYYLTAEYAYCYIIRTGNESQITLSNLSTLIAPLWDTDYIHTNGNTHLVTLTRLTSTNDGTYGYTYAEEYLDMNDPTDHEIDFGEQVNNKLPDDAKILTPHVIENYSPWIQYIDDIKLSGSGEYTTRGDYRTFNVSTGFQKISWNMEYRSWYYMDSKGDVRHLDATSYYANNVRDNWGFIIDNDEHRISIENGVYKLTNSSGSSKYTAFYTKPITATVYNYIKDSDGYIRGDTVINFSISNIVSDITLRLVDAANSITDYSYPIYFVSNFGGTMGENIPLNYTVGADGTIDPDNNNRFFVNSEKTIISSIGYNETTFKNFNASMQTSEIVDNKRIYIPHTIGTVNYFSASIATVAQSNNIGLTSKYDGEGNKYYMNNVLLEGVTSESRSFVKDGQTYYFSERLITEFIGWKLVFEEGTNINNYLEDIKNEDLTDAYDMLGGKAVNPSGIVTYEQLLTLQFVFKDNDTSLFFEAVYKELAYDVEIYSWAMDSNGGYTYDVLENIYKKQSGGENYVDYEIVAAPEGSENSTYDRYTLKPTTEQAGGALTYNTVINYTYNGEFLNKMIFDGFGNGVNDVKSINTVAYDRDERTVTDFAEFKGFYKIAYYTDENFEENILAIDGQGNKVDSPVNLAAFMDLNAVISYLTDTLGYEQTTIWNGREYYTNANNDKYFMISKKESTYTFEVYEKFYFYILGGNAIVTNSTGTYLTDDIKLYAIFEDKTFNVSATLSDGLNYNETTMVSLNNYGYVNVNVNEEYTQSLRNNVKFVKENLADSDYINSYLLNAGNFVKALEINADTLYGALSYDGGNYALSYGEENGETYFIFTIAEFKETVDDEVQVVATAYVKFNQNLTSFTIAIPNIIDDSTIVLDTDKFNFAINTYTVTITDPSLNDFDYTYGTFKIGVKVLANGDPYTDNGEDWTSWSYYAIAGANIEDINVLLAHQGVVVEYNDGEIILTVNHNVSIRFSFTQSDAYENYFNGANQPLLLEKWVDVDNDGVFDDIHSTGAGVNFAKASEANKDNWTMGQTSFFADNARQADFQIVDITNDYVVKFKNDIVIRKFEVTDNRGENQYYTYEVKPDPLYNEGGDIINGDSSVIEYGNDGDIIYTINDAYTQTTPFLVVGDNIIIFANKYDEEQWVEETNYKTLIVKIDKTVTITVYYYETEVEDLNGNGEVDTNFYYYNYNNVNYYIVETFDANFSDYYEIQTNTSSNTDISTFGYINKHDENNPYTYAFKFINMNNVKRTQLTGDYRDGENEWTLNTYTVSAPTNFNDGSNDIFAEITTQVNESEALNGSVKHGDSLVVEMSVNQMYTQTLPTFIINGEEHVFTIDSSNSAYNTDADSNITNTIVINGMTIVITQVVTLDTNFDNTSEFAKFINDVNLVSNDLYLTAKYVIFVEEIVNDLSVSVKYEDSEENPLFNLNKYFIVFNQRVGEDTTQLEFNGTTYYQYITHGQTGVSPFSGNAYYYYDREITDQVISATQFSSGIEGYDFNDSHGENFLDANGDTASYNAMSSHMVVYALYTEESYQFTTSGNKQNANNDIVGEITTSKQGTVKYTETDDLTVTFEYYVPYDKDTNVRFNISTYHGIALMPGDEYGTVGAKVDNLVNVGDSAEYFHTVGEAPNETNYDYVVKLTSISDDRLTKVYSYYEKGYENEGQELFTITTNYNRATGNERLVNDQKSTTYTLSFVRKIDAGVSGSAFGVEVITTNVVKNTYTVKFNGAIAPNAPDNNAFKLLDLDNINFELSNTSNPLEHGVAFVGIEDANSAANVPGYDIKGWYLYNDTDKYTKLIMSKLGKFQQYTGQTEYEYICDDFEVWAMYERDTYIIQAKIANTYANYFEGCEVSNSDLVYGDTTTITFTLKKKYDQYGINNKLEFCVYDSDSSLVNNSLAYMVGNPAFNNGVYTITIKYAIANIYIGIKAGQEASLEANPNKYTVLVYKATGNSPEEIASHAEYKNLTHDSTVNQNVDGIGNPLNATFPQGTNFKDFKGYTFQGWYAIETVNHNNFKQWYTLGYFDSQDYSHNYYDEKGVIKEDVIEAKLGTKFSFDRVDGTAITRNMSVFPLYTRNLVTITFTERVFENGNVVKETDLNILESLGLDNVGENGKTSYQFTIPYGLPLIDDTNNEAVTYDQQFISLENLAQNNSGYYQFASYKTPTQTAWYLKEIYADNVEIFVDFERKDFVVTLLSAEEDYSNAITVLVKYGDPISNDLAINSWIKGGENFDTDIIDTVGEWISVNTGHGRQFNGWGRKSGSEIDFIDQTSTFYAIIPFKSYVFKFEIEDTAGGLSVAVGTSVEGEINPETSTTTGEISVSYEKDLSLIYNYATGHTAPPTLEIKINNEDNYVIYLENENTVTSPIGAIYTQLINDYYQIKIQNYTDINSGDYVEVMIKGNKRTHVIDSIEAQDIVMQMPTSTYRYNTNVFADANNENYKNYTGYKADNGDVPIIFRYGKVNYGEVFEFNVYISERYLKSTEFKFTLKSGPDGNLIERHYVAGLNSDSYLSYSDNNDILGEKYRIYKFALGDASQGIIDNIKFIVNHNASVVRANQYKITFNYAFGGHTNDWKIEPKGSYYVNSSGERVSDDSISLPLPDEFSDYTSYAHQWMININDTLGLDESSIRLDDIASNFKKFTQVGYQYKDDINVYYFFIVKTHEVEKATTNTDKGGFEAEVNADQRSTQNEGKGSGYKFAYTLSDKYTQNTPIISIIGLLRSYDLLTVRLSDLNSMEVGDEMIVNKTSESAYKVTKLANGYKYELISVARSSEVYNVEVEGGVYTFTLGANTLASGAFDSANNKYNFTLNYVTEKFTLDVNDEMFTVNAYKVTFKHVDGREEVKEVEYMAKLTTIPTDEANFIQKVVYVVTYADGTQAKLSSKKLAQLEISEDLNVEIKVELNLVVIIAIAVGALVVIIALIVLIVKAKNSKQDRSRSQRSNMEMFDRLNQAKANDTSKKSDKPYNPYIDNSKNNKK